MLQFIHAIARRDVLRASFIRLIGSLLVVSILALLGAQLAQAESAQDADALNRQAVQLINLGKYSEAFAIAEHALSLAEKRLGPDHPSTLISVNNLGFLYQAQGSCREAEPLYRRAQSHTERLRSQFAPQQPKSVPFQYREDRTRPAASSHIRHPNVSRCQCWASQSAHFPGFARSRFGMRGQRNSDRRSRAGRRSPHWNSGC